MHYIEIAYPSGLVLKVPDHLAQTYANIASSARTLFEEFDWRRCYSTGYHYEQVGEHEWIIYKLDDKPYFWVMAERQPNGAIITQCEAVEQSEAGNIIPVGPCPSKRKYGVCKHEQAVVLACIDKRTTP